MKKSIFLLGLILVFAGQLSAQPKMEKLPIDPKVKYGKLDNGLTYYIRHNELPKERAEFFIAQNVGSILEEDNQNGLAHFLEHMAFNGSKSFPGNKLVGYLETIGVKFGQNLNAYTSWDRTVYNISDVPTTRESIVDSCLLILHDWSGALSLDEKEIDKERGVIREEMRSYGGAQWRTLEKILPQVLPGNQYAKRNIIGTADVIMNFKPQELRDYYHKWYRPDLQAVIIIGDIDPDQIESKLKTVFADIPKPVNAAERTHFQVEDNPEPLVAVVTDKEATYTRISIDYKHKPAPDEVKASSVGLMLNFFNSVISQMMNTRLNEIREKPTAPFNSAYCYQGDFANTMTEEAWSIGATVKENNTEDCLKTITREMERIKRFGFTASEYDRARTDILTRYESAFKEKDKTLNRNYASEYVNHFTKGGYIPGIETEYNMLNNIAPAIKVESINQIIKEMITDKNVVISLTGPEKEGVETPSKDQLLAWFEGAKAENIEAYQDKVSNEPLMKELPAGGSVKSESKDEKFGTVNYTLSNGVKVVIKPTTFKDDEILMSASSPGGSSHFPESDLTNIKIYHSASTLGGLGAFSQTDLNKVLSGKNVSVQPTMTLTHEGFSGNAAPKDFETMLQLIYLNFTAPRMDQDAYEAFISRTKSQLESQLAAPEIALVDTMNNVLNKNRDRNSRLKSEDLATANYQTIMNWRKDRYKDASDFTFVFIGNIDPVATKDLIAKYLGSLPSINRKESWKTVEAGIKTGEKKVDFEKQMLEPKATVIDVYSGTLKTDMSTRLKMNILSQILRLIYTEKVREEAGGTYGVSVGGSIADYPKGQASIQVYFQTDVPKKDELNTIILNEFKALAASGPREEDFQKTKEFMLKDQQQQLQENGYWNHIITNFYRVGYDGYTNYTQTVNAITPTDIKALANELLDQKNLIQVIMTGVK